MNRGPGPLREPLYMYRRNAAIQRLVWRHGADTFTGAQPSKFMSSALNWNCAEDSDTLLEYDPMNQSETLNSVHNAENTRT